MRKIITVAMTTALLFSSMTVYAAEPTASAKQNAEYMMQKDEDGVPNWFVGTYYGGKYEDLELAFGYNEELLFKHSYEYGFRESRVVSPVLDVVQYRKFYPDLGVAFGDNWNAYINHYFEFGIQEGRKNFTDFNAETYLGLYPDLHKAFGNDLGLATRHYLEFGYEEGREISLPVEEIEDDDETDRSEGTIVPSEPSETLNGDVREELGDGAYVILTYENGLLIVQTMYDASNEETHRREYTYDENGNNIEEKEYQDGGDTYVYRVAHEYNANDQRTRTIEYAVNMEANEDVVNRTISYEYYSNGNLHTSTSYRADDTLERVTTYTEEGNFESDIFYDESGNPES